MKKGDKTTQSKQQFHSGQKLLQPIPIFSGSSSELPLNGPPRELFTHYALNKKPGYFQQVISLNNAAITTLSVTKTYQSDAHKNPPHQN